MTPPTDRAFVDGLAAQPCQLRSPTHETCEARAIIPKKWCDHCRARHVQVHRPAEDAESRARTVVGGRFMERSLDAFVRGCEVAIEDIARSPVGDNAVLALLCDAVRLAREHVAYVKAAPDESRARAAEAEANRVRTAAVRDLHREYLERTPSGTRLCYLTGNRVTVLGQPGDDHNCDAMGCGSFDHVVEVHRLADGAAEARASHLYSCSRCMPGDACSAYREMRLRHARQSTEAPVDERLMHLTDWQRTTEDSRRLSPGGGIAARALPSGRWWAFTGRDQATGKTADLASAEEAADAYLRTRGDLFRLPVPTPGRGGR